MGVGGDCELTMGCYSEGNYPNLPQQIDTAVIPAHMFKVLLSVFNKTPTPASLGYPLSVVIKKLYSRRTRGTRALYWRVHGGLQKVRPKPPKYGEIALWLPMNMDPYVLILAGSESTITEIAEYIYFNLQQAIIRLKFQIELNSRFV